MAHDLLIVGAGPVGMALALALRDSGLDFVLVEARERGAARNDPRMLALAHGSRLTLQRLGVWDELAATPITSIHVSQQGGFGRTRIDAAEHHLPALGYVVAAGALASALDRAIATHAIPVIDGSRVGHLEAGTDEVLVSLEGARPSALRTRLVACAEGGMRGDDPGVGGRDYRQHAVTALATPEQPHLGLAYERFTAEGPVALLPCGQRYAVVHSASPERAGRLMALPEGEYLNELEDCLGRRVRFVRIDARHCFPLALRYRVDPVGPRTVWLGNAAQTLHPVAGQGFNLALRDVWGLAETLLAAGPAEDPGEPRLLAEYRRRRLLDRRATIGVTDTLVQLFSNSRSALRLLRGAGLMALDLCPPARAGLARRMMFGARAWP